MAALTKICGVNLGIPQKYALVEPPENSEYKVYKQAEQNHCSYREIKAKVLFFYSDISRQITDPIKPTAKEIYN